MSLILVFKGLKNLLHFTNRNKLDFFQPKMNFKFFKINLNFIQDFEKLSILIMFVGNIEKQLRFEHKNKRR